MDKLRSGARQLGLELNAQQLEQFQTYYEELIAWNQRMNLTTITTYEDVQVKHFLDSLTVALALKPPTPPDFPVIDVGTGAGLPGIPLKILWPQIRLVLLEATAKKTVFLHHIITKLGLKGVAVVGGRAEELAHQSQYREQFGLVLSRAVARLATLVELALPFCAIGGHLVAQKQGNIDEEVKEAERAIGLLGGKGGGVAEIPLAELATHRLVIIEKIAPTPEKHPRRPGLPARRPLR